MQTLEAQQFDVVLLDYLLAAVHMHWPYGEDQVLERVLRALRPRGLALLTGTCVCRERARVGAGDGGLIG